MVWTTRTVLHPPAGQVEILQNGVSVLINSYTVMSWEKDCTALTDCVAISMSNASLLRYEVEDASGPLLSFPSPPLKTKSGRHLQLWLHCGDMADLEEATLSLGWKTIATTETFWGVSVMEHLVKLPIQIVASTFAFAAMSRPKTWVDAIWKSLSKVLALPNPSPSIEKRLRLPSIWFEFEIGTTLSSAPFWSDEEELSCDPDGITCVDA